MLTVVIGSEKTCSKIGKGKVSGSTSFRAMDIGKFVFRDCMHLELPDPELQKLSSGVWPGLSMAKTCTTVGESPCSAK
uniref:Coatomer beta subunit n=1 Tax=Solanum tuberosum TaxID=4113 RepID=M1CSF2_SOLTU